MTAPRATAGSIASTVCGLEAAAFLNEHPLHEDEALGYIKDLSAEKGCDPGEVLRFVIDHLYDERAARRLATAAEGSGLMFGRLNQGTPPARGWGRQAQKRSTPMKKPKKPKGYNAALKRRFGGKATAADNRLINDYNRKLSAWRMTHQRQQQRAFERRASRPMGPMGKDHKRKPAGRTPSPALPMVFGKRVPFTRAHPAALEAARLIGGMDEQSPHGTFATHDEALYQGEIMPEGPVAGSWEGWQPHSSGLIFNSVLGSFSYHPRTNELEFFAGISELAHKGGWEYAYWAPSEPDVDPNHRLHTSLWTLQDEYFIQDDPRDTAARFYDVLLGRKPLPEAGQTRPVEGPTGEWTRGGVILPRHGSLSALARGGPVVTHPQRLRLDALRKMMRVSGPGMAAARRARRKKKQRPRKKQPGPATEGWPPGVPVQYGEHGGPGVAKPPKALFRKMFAGEATPAEKATIQAWLRQEQRRKALAVRAANPSPSWKRGMRWPPLPPLKEGDLNRGRRATTTRQRRRMPQSDFALPITAQNPKFRATHPAFAGAYPMQDRSHGANARARAVQMLNKGFLSLEEARTIFARTTERWGFARKRLEQVDGAWRSVDIGVPRRRAAANRHGQAAEEACDLCGTIHPHDVACTDVDLAEAQGQGNRNTACPLSDSSLLERVFAQG